MSHILEINCHSDFLDSIFESVFYICIRIKRKRVKN